MGKANLTTMPFLPADRWSAREVPHSDSDNLSTLHLNEQGANLVLSRYCRETADESA